MSEGEEAFYVEAIVWGNAQKIEFILGRKSRNHFPFRRLMCRKNGNYTWNSKGDLSEENGISYKLKNIYIHMPKIIKCWCKEKKTK